jgi:hypothetical protein
MPRNHKEIYINEFSLRVESAAAVLFFKTAMHEHLGTKSATVGPILFNILLFCRGDGKDLDHSNCNRSESWKSKRIIIFV